jgi:murein DD-endopeptidase MepM/ murein hydrolase activator NlpD
LKKLRKKVKTLIIIIAVLAILQLILLFTVLFFIVRGDGIISSPEDSANKTEFAQILKDSIQIYGTDFTGALTLYLIENITFDDYKKEKFDFTRKEVQETFKDNNEISVFKIAFDVLYDGIVKEHKKGNTYYNWYYPIAEGYEVGVSNDWGDDRANGERSHEGNDFMCDEGTPIIAVESGTVENIGWNELGGWRLGIITETNRYWYYAHMRNSKPYIDNLKEGDKVEAGQVIGYVGDTGYGELGTTGKFDFHLHLGVYKRVLGKNIAYNPYAIAKVLEANKVDVKKVGNEYVAIKKSIEDRYIISSSVVNIDGNQIGFLSEKYESNGNPGVIANNPGDPGGKSYGAFQFAVNRGSMTSFLIWLRNVDKLLYDKLMNAYIRDGNWYGSNFDSVWKEIAREQTDYFYNLQYTYIKSAYFDPLVSYFKPRGFDILSRSKTLQAVIWSTSVQHGTGGATSILLKQDLTSDDRTIIIGIYNERMKVNIHFPSASASVKQSVYYRFKNELQDALASLEAEGR